MYTRAQTSATGMNISPTEKSDKTQSDQAELSFENSPKRAPENAQTSAPAVAKKPKYRAARGGKIDASLKHPDTNGDMRDSRSQGCEKAPNASPCGAEAPPDFGSENAEKTPPDLTRKCPNCDFSKEHEPHFPPCPSPPQSPPITPEEACDTNESPQICPMPSRKGGLSSLFDSFCTDELLVLALLVLLFLQGSDDILILALCFILL